jgi:hypothetical protein
MNECVGGRENMHVWERDFFHPVGNLLVYHVGNDKTSILFQATTYYWLFMFSVFTKFAY